MKKITTSIALVSVIALFALINGCGKDSDSGCTGSDHDTDNIAEKLTSSSTYSIVEPEAPEGGYCIYLDASGSMPGYFTDGLTEYIKLVSGLQGGNDSNKVYFWGDDTREVTNLNSTITKGNYNASASLFPAIFKKMAGKARSEKALTFLVTDGIVSNASKVTKQRTGYTIADLPLLPAKIKDAIGDSMAVAIFRCEIPFNGKYWDIDNKDKRIECKRRPIFVFAIGYPGAVVDLKNSVSNKKKEMENLTSMKPEQLYMGIFKTEINRNPFKDNEGNRFITNEDTTNIILDPGYNDFELSVDVPKWIAEMGADPTKDGIIKILNADGTKIDVDKVYSDGVMKFSTNVVYDKEDEGDNKEFNIGDYTVDYTIVYRPSDKWKRYNCEDDRALSSDTLCDRTFGLNAILQGFELATHQPDTLLTSSFKFTK